MYGSLGATRELSGRSLGALWELVAVAGITARIGFSVDSDLHEKSLRRIGSREMVQEPCRIGSMFLFPFNFFLFSVQIEFVVR